MPKILKIEESKIVTKNGQEVQRVIFSDDKIAYVRMSDGEVFPKNVPDTYINLINTYNAAHDNPSAFWGEDKNYIKDGTIDRRNQIENAKNKKRLSKNRDTQNAINRVRDYGLILRICGIIQIILVGGLWFIQMVLSGGINSESVVIPYSIICIINVILGIAYDILGNKIHKLEYAPSSIRATAIVVLVICGLDLLSGALGVMGIIVMVYSIIALVKVGRYEEWFYGEIE